MRHKALALLSNFEYISHPVKIISHRREVGAAIVTLRDYFWRKEEPWGVIDLPSGRRMAIPLAWTDIPKNKLPVLIQRPQLDARRLLEMATFCQQLQTPQKPKHRKKISETK
jgi:hypothetical protein